MFCPRCGKEVVEGVRFCQACGQEVGAPVAIATAAVAGTIPAPPMVSAGVSAPRPYAGFWVRFAAYFVDSLILGIPFTIALFAIFMFAGVGAMMRRHTPVDPNEVAASFAPMFATMIPVMLFLILVSWLYYAGMESSARQATLGKSVMSLRVTNGEGQRLSFGHATGRFFAKIISGMIPFAIGYIMAGFTEKKQALHDLIAGTLVLKR
jgi:uncharacterized RDD family membrane protein YckC